MSGTNSLSGSSSSESRFSTTSTSSASTSSSSATQSGTTQASTTSTSATLSDATQSSTSVAQGTQSAQPAKSSSPGLSGGAVGGIAAAALIVGVLIASLIFIMLQKKNKRRNRSQRTSALGTQSTTDRPDEKSARTNVAVAPQNETFDLDRLLPQPFDDSKIQSEVKLLFTQIDGHVENFYTESKVSSTTRVSTDASESEMLLYPRTRFFALKRLICLAMLEAISLDCPSEQSLLPLGFGTISRQLKEVNLDDQGKSYHRCSSSTNLTYVANTLSWARLRSSMGYLLKSNLGPAEQKRLDRVVGTIVERLNTQTQVFELAGTKNDRAADMNAICRSSATLGRLLLSQPAEWKFDWRGTSNASAGSRSQLVYLPSLVRLTDNKGKRLRTPHIAIAPTTTSV